jgi:peptide/nickel transport system permease protein
VEGSAHAGVPVATVETPARLTALRTTLDSVLDVLKRDRLAATGVLIYIVVLAVAILAPAIAPYDPQTVISDNGIWLTDEPPSRTFLLGTTNVARDIFSQLVYGSRAALIVGFSAAVVVAVVGTIVGLVAGYFGGPVDRALMGLTDVAFGIPFLPFVIVLLSFLEASILNIVFAIGLLLWRDTARVIRSQVLTVRERAFVQAAKAAGASPWRVIFLYVAPNILPLSLLYGTLAVGWAILTEASLSFLGFGDPNAVSWGFMLQDAYINQALERGAYYWFVPPGVCIVLVVMAGFFIGRGYEELLYPRLRSR